MFVRNKNAIYIGKTISRTILFNLVINEYFSKSCQCKKVKIVHGTILHFKSLYIHVHVFIKPINST